MRVRFRSRRFPMANKVGLSPVMQVMGAPRATGTWGPGTELSEPRDVPDIAAVIETGQPPQAVAERARIVVADDQPDVRMALSLFFKSDDHEVEAVGSPTALLEAAGRGASLILMDLNYTR